MDELSVLSKQLEMIANAIKTKWMYFGPNTRKIIKLFLDGTLIERVMMFKYLGAWICANLNGNEHLKVRIQSSLNASFTLNMIGLNTYKLSRKIKSLLFEAYIRSRSRYAISNINFNKAMLQLLKRHEGNMITRIFGLNTRVSTTKLFKALSLESTESVIRRSKLNLFNQMYNHEIMNKLLKKRFETYGQLSNEEFLKELVETHLASEMANYNSLAEIYKSVRIQLIKKKEKMDDEIECIRDLLDNRTKDNNELLETLLAKFYTDEPKTG